MVYVLEESITASTKKAKARLLEGDPFNSLIAYTEGVVDINVKDIGGSLEETVRGDGNIELTENELIRYQSRMIECVDAVTIEEAREISEGLDTDQDRAEDARSRRASRARKRPHTDDFLYYDDWKGEVRILSISRPSIISICWKKLMQLRFILIFVMKYFHKVKNITEIMIKIYQQHCQTFNQLFCFFQLGRICKE